MTHVRASILAAAAAAVTGLATTGARVYQSRNLPLTATEFPSLCVYARRDPTDYSEASYGDGTVDVVRTAEIHIQGYVVDSDGPTIEATLDQIAAEVETALFAAFPFAGAQRMKLGEQVLDVDDEGEETVGTIDMIFNVEYRTAEGAPEAAT